MNFPPFDIKIATYTWKILFVDKKDRELEGDYGCCDYNKKAIFIDNSLNAEQTWFTLLHELTHAFLEEATFESDLSKLLDKNYERFIELFSRNLDSLFSLEDLRKEIFCFNIRHINRLDYNSNSNFKGE